MNQLLIATNNKGKIEELQDLLKDLHVKLVTPADINLDLDVIEDGLTYAENATKKAVAFANASGLISLADDSGLEVDALDGAPGLYSSRYGAPGGSKLTDGERRKLLIKNLQPFPRPWTARFKATIAIAIPTVILNEVKGLKENQAETLRSPASSSDFVLRSPFVPRGSAARRCETAAGGSLRVTCAEGICEGEIIPEERGTGGFGYDPIFLFPELGKTMAELDMDAKNRLSHRAKAVMMMKDNSRLISS